jgi:hypothetical protein
VASKKNPRKRGQIRGSLKHLLPTTSLPVAGLRDDRVSQNPSTIAEIENFNYRAKTPHSTKSDDYEKPYPEFRSGGLQTETRIDANNAI